MSLSLLTFLMSVCHCFLVLIIMLNFLYRVSVYVSNVCVSLSSCIDNYYVFLLCIVSLSLLTFLMSLGPWPLPFCVDNYVVLLFLASLFTFLMSVSCVLVVLC